MWVERAPYAGGGAGGESSLSVRGRTPRVRFQMMVGRSHTTYARHPEQRFPARERGDGESYVAHRIRIEGRREQKGESPLRRHNGVQCLTYNTRARTSRRWHCVDSEVSGRGGKADSRAMSVERGGGVSKSCLPSMRPFGGGAGESRER